MYLLQKIKNTFFKVPEYEQVQNSYTGGIFHDMFDGGKYPGSLGPVKSYKFVDYYTLRSRSSELFKTNPYCIGIMRRMLRNEISTGLNLEASPVESILGISEDEALEWANNREIDWKIWSENPDLCDQNKLKTLAELAADCRQTALIAGDCLVVLRINKKTGLPAIELIDGTHIQSPFADQRQKEKKIVHGIELKNKRQVAFWVRQENSKFKRIPAVGEKSGRRIAWMVYGCERRLDEVRGEPILSNMLYMLKELDKYRDSEQRAATINSLIPMFIERDVNAGMSTKPADGGAVRKKTVNVNQPEGGTKKWNLASWLPGMVPQNLAKGEKPVSFQTQRPNVNFGKFEETIINTFSWTLEVPPEIVRLLFQSNFSASRQANNEFEIYLKYRNWKHGSDFYKNPYQEWLIQQALMGDIQSQSLLDSWRDPRRWREFGAWVNSVWTGINRPSVDFKKDVDAAAKAIDYGLTTQNQQCMKLSGLPYKVVLQKRKREIEAMKAAGISFASEEDQNRQPISGTPVEHEESGNVLNARIKKLENKITEIQENFEEMEAANNG